MLDLWCLSSSNSQGEQDGGPIVNVLGQYPLWIARGMPLCLNHGAVFYLMGGKDLARRLTHPKLTAFTVPGYRRRHYLRRTLVSNLHYTTDRGSPQSHWELQVMSASLQGSRELPASQYDLSTYWGRVRQSAEIADPR